MCKLSYADAEAHMIWGNSYEHLGMLLQLRRQMSVPDWWRLLGEWWSSCDNIFAHKDRLRAYLLKANGSNLRAMMSSHERRAVGYLPPVVTVYRGCYAVNRDGLSWTLSREVAVRFPTQNRYRRTGDVPLLLTGAVERQRLVLKLDRKEREAICASVQVTDEQSITPTAPTSTLKFAEPSEASGTTKAPTPETTKPITMDGLLQG